MPLPVVKERTTASTHTSLSGTEKSISRRDALRRYVLNAGYKSWEIKSARFTERQNRSITRGFIATV
jgi:hypothetical protein